MNENQNPLNPVAPPAEPVKKITSLRPGNAERIRAAAKSAAIFIGIPVFIAILYFGFIASDQYVAKAAFAIRSQEPSMADGFGFLGLGRDTGTGADMSIVQSYIQSRQLLEDMEPFLNLRKIYSNPKGDFIARLNPGLQEEELLEYWKKMVTVTYDGTSSLAELNVKAFDPEEAKMVAERVLTLSEKLVNRLSDRSRNDALKVAKSETENAYNRVVKAIESLQDFSANSQQIDPQGFATVKGGIQATLDGELVQYEAELAMLRQSLPEDAPGIQRLKNRLAVTKAQLASERQQTTTSSNKDSANEMLGDFAKLRMESEFAEKAYLSALTSLETARIEAARQTRYLEAFIAPQLPEYPEFPRRLRNIFLTLLVAVGLWFIGNLMIAATKEHL